MNIIQVKIDFEQGTCQKQGISVVTGDYNSTKIEFEFNESATGTKIFEMKDPNDNLVYADEIIDNEVVLVGQADVKDDNGYIKYLDESDNVYWYDSANETLYNSSYEEATGVELDTLTKQTETTSLFGEEGDYTFEVSLYQNNGRLTSVCDYITANKEQVIVDGEEVQERITLFDNLMNDLSEKIVETNNLDLDAEKVGTTTTVTLTKKDGTTKEVEILDGEKGDKGDKGDKGEQGIQGIQGEQGDTGNGIANIQKTSTSGLVDTYTITFTNGQTTNYTITNGANGSVVDVQVDGTSVVDNGIANITGLNAIKRDIEDIYKAWPKVKGEGTELSLNNTVEGKMKVDLKGNTYQNGEPTPDTPIPVQVVSGDNTIKVEGKNLLSGIEQGSLNSSGEPISSTVAIRSINYDNVVPNTQYTISINGTATPINVAQYDKNKSFISFTFYNGTFTTSANTYYIKITKSGSVSDLFQIEASSTATTYTPYVSQTYPISLGNIELCKIEDYQDSIVKDNGKWFLNKQIGKVVLDGDNKSVAYVNVYNDIYQYQYSAQGIMSDYSQNTIYAISNLFKGVIWNANWTIDNSTALQNNGNLRLNTSKFDNANDFNVWLQTNNTIVYYVLATPTYEEITDTTLLGQLNALENANSYNNTTNVSQSNDDLASILDVTALEDIS